ncbi:hypothetical protein CALCODRAFT_497397 [Calocera cornea HHB12733]|uniref:Uncharacterized protein n=1 Tax=Calocera cornea HHB12733 TaxID=1353952 RepID=A0A165FB12_9BASI|nr:hypothetical protein CALCODRAFT_497397 [Calocera cornea HHB12733]
MVLLSTLALNSLLWVSLALAAPPSFGRQRSDFFDRPDTLAPRGMYLMDDTGTVFLAARYVDFDDPELLARALPGSGLLRKVGRFLGIRKGKAKETTDPADANAERDAEIARVEAAAAKEREAKIAREAKNRRRNSATIGRQRVARESKELRRGTFIDTHPPSP